MKSRLIYGVIGASVLAIGVFTFVIKAQAQAGEATRPTGFGSIHFQTNLGSFKIIAVGDEPVTGTISLSFTGSVLVSGATSPVKVSGNLIKEYDNPKFNKVGYHGTGTISVTGPLRSLQWFGSNMKGDFTGRAQIRFYGDFDKDLHTGTFWTTDPTLLSNWSANSVLTVVVPPYASSGYDSGVKPESRQQFEQGHKQ